MKIRFLLKWIFVLIGILVVLTFVKGIAIIGVLLLLVAMFFSLREHINKGIDYFKRVIGGIFN
tara:strand:- start:304 stop:492 length:189 start_codon:yes stop_codon:yes gene_type:complete